MKVGPRALNINIREQIERVLGAFFEGSILGNNSDRSSSHDS